MVLSASFFLGSAYGLEGLAYSWLVFPVVFLITTSITLRLVKLPLLDYFKELRHPFLGTAFMVIAVLTVQSAVLGGPQPCHACGGHGGRGGARLLPVFRTF